MSDLDVLPGWGSLRADAAPEPTARVAQGPQARPVRRDSIRNAISGFGDPSFDKSVSSRPNPYQIPLSDDELRALYGYSGISRRIVDLIPSRATRKGWSVPDIGVSEDRRLYTWDRVCLAGQMARLLGSAVVLMVTEDDIPRASRADPSRWLEQPMDPERVGVLQALHVFDGIDARPVAWETDLRQPGYRLPRIWSLRVEGRGSLRVHASRVLHFRGARRLPSEIRGSWTSTQPDDSVLQVVWNEISRLETVMQANAIFAQELRHTILKIGDLTDKQVGDEADLLEARFALMRRSLGLTGMSVIGPGDELYSNSNAPTGIRDLSDGAFQMLCTALGWPASMLSGEPPGGLSTDDASGLERERALVSDYQETELRHLLEQLYRTIYRSQDGPTGGVEPEEWEVSFAALNEPSAKETAEVRKLTAETDAILIASKVVRPQDVTISRYSDDGWNLDLQPVEPLDEEEIAPEPVVDPNADPEVDPENPDTDPEDDEPRGDAIDADSVCILVPAADPGLRAAVSAAIRQPLTVEGEPHVTALYLGRGHGQRKIAEIIRAVEEEARVTEAGSLMQGALRAFPHGPDGTPIVVEFSDTWAITSLHDRLLRRLAHLVRTKQHRTYRPHLTVGYAREPLPPEATTALLGIDVSAVRVGVSELRVQVGGRVVASVAVGG